MLKKVLCGILVLAMLTLALAGCSGDADSPEGRYTLERVVMYGVEQTPQGFFNMIEVPYFEMRIELQPDGVLLTNAHSLSGELELGVWKINGDKVTMTINDESTDVTWSGKTITANLSNGTLFFEK
jgi:hypothetical protein